MVRAGTLLPSELSGELLDGLEFVRHSGGRLEAGYLYPQARSQAQQTKPLASGLGAHPPPPPASASP